MRINGTCAIALLLFASSALAAGCGDSSDSAVGKVTTFAQPTQNPPPDVPAEPIERNEPGGGILNSPAYRKFARKQITELVNRFQAAAARGDADAMCALFANRGVNAARGNRACTGFFAGALGRQRSSKPLLISKITLLHGGRAAEVQLRHFGRNFEAEREDEQWYLEEVPGF
jgi:hypothetical protein